MSFAWFQLICAGILEICWAVGLKYTEGFTRLWPSLFTFIALVGSIFLLAKATEVLPLGASYAIWVGIGAFGTMILGIILFNESLSTIKLIFLTMLLVSILGLKFTST